MQFSRYYSSFETPCEIVNKRLAAIWMALESPYRKFAFSPAATVHAYTHIYNLVCSVCRNFGIMGNNLEELYKDRSLRCTECILKCERSI